jgi:hypothetical protein
MFSTAGNSHQQWKDREAAQAAAGYYNDSSVDLAPRDAIEPCHICFGRNSHTCKACNGRGTVWVETIELRS